MDNMPSRGGGREGKGNVSAPSLTVGFEIDTVTPPPIVTVANGQGLAGSAEAGAVITLLDRDGNPVLDSRGAPVTALADDQGQWTLPASVVPGGLNGFDGAVRATDIAGNTAATDVGPVDGVTEPPVITGANGRGLEGTAEPGATLTLLDEFGQPVIGSNGETVTTQAGPDGVWTIPPAAVTGGLDGFEGAVRAVDAAGNTATSPVGPIDGSILVSINIDAVTGDNVINLAESTSASLIVSGGTFGDFNPGDAVTVRLSNGASQTTTLTADGSWSVAFPGAALAASSSVTVELTATDALGNSVVVTDVQAYGLDLTGPDAPSITSANGQGVSGTAEIGAAIVLVDSLGNPVIGPDGQPVTTSAGPDGRWTIPANAFENGPDGFTGGVRAVDAAGNPSGVTSVGPIDGVTATPQVTVANGVEIRGEAEAGATITLLDATGQPVVGAGGLPVTALVDQDGQWILPASAVPGGADGFSGAVRVEDLAGNTGQTVVGPIDGATPAPVVTAANGALLQGTAEPGATVTLLDETGAVVTLDGAPVTALVGPDGVWTIPADAVPNGLDGFVGSVRAVDPAGNTAATAFGPVDGSVDVSVLIDPVTADNVLNGVEAATPALIITGSLAGEVPASATVRVTLQNGVFQDVPVNAQGEWSATFSGADLAAGGRITASVSVEDEAGNTVIVTEDRTYVVDLITAAPMITQANAGGLAGTAEAGAAIEVRNAAGTVVGATFADPSGQWSIPAAEIIGPLDGLSGSVRATDAAGNAAISVLAPVDARLELAIAIEPVTADNVINIVESGQVVQVRGSVTGEVSAGDQVVVVLANGQSQTTSVDASGSWVVSFDGADLAASAGLTVTVTSTDASGNTGSVSTEAVFGVDVTAPAAPIVVSAGGSGLGGTAEPNTTVQLLDGAGLPVIGEDGAPLTALVSPVGQWTIPASAFVGGQVPPGFSGQAVTVDLAGNVSTPTSIPAIDLTPPDSTTTQLFIDIIAGDDVVNLAESGGPITISGSVSGEYRAGDIVTITAGAVSATGVVEPGGRWSAVIAGSALTGGVLQATIQATDPAGNVGAITAIRPYAADLVSPGGPDGTSAPGLAIAAAADGFIDPVELAAGVPAVVTLTPTSQVGDTLTVTLTAGGVVRTVERELDAQDIANGTVTLPLTASLVDGAYTAIAVVRDPAGNSSAPSNTISFEVDAIALAVDDDNASVTEAALGAVVAGSLDVTGATGSVTFTLQAPTTPITSRGAPVSWIEADGVLIGSAGGREVIRVTIDANGDYTVVLSDAVDHSGAGADTLQLAIGVVATDADGSTAATLNVGVIDGTPQLSGPVTFNPVQPGVIVGTLLESFGADGGRLTSVTVDGRTFTLDPATGAVSASGPAGSVIAYSARDGVLTATTSRGETVTVDFDTGAYRVDVTGRALTPETPQTPTVALGGGSGLLGLLDANALGLIELGGQQFFTASDRNNDITQVVVRYSASLSLANKFFGYSSLLATELGLSVVQTNVPGLSTSSQLVIRAADGGAVDNLKLNEFLGSITFDGGLAGLLSLNIAQSLQISAQDASGRTALEIESSLAELGVLANLLGATPPAQIINGTGGNDSIPARDVGVGSALDQRIYGFGGNDTLNGGLGNDLLRGGTGADVLDGGAGNDLLIGGAGNDTLTGGAGRDVFRWERGDQGSVGAPAVDVVTDFSVASLALGGDILDLSSLLQGEGRIGVNPGNLTNYIHFQQTAEGTLIHISTTGQFIGGFGSATAAGADQTILLRGVDLTSGFGSDQAILTDLLQRGKLIVDELTGPAAPAGSLVIGGTAVDGDGDGGSTSITIDGSGVRPPTGANAAPVVEAQAEALLGVLGLGALGLTLGNQDLLAADPDNNLARVEVEYAPLLALNLSPITFGFAQTLASEYGYRVTVSTSPGLLGVVAPTARIVITALDGGALDNVEINRFLESVHLTDTSGALLSSTLLSAQLLNALTITAADTLGLASSVTVGSVVNVNALNSLDGPDAGFSGQALAALESDGDGFVSDAAWGVADVVDLSDEAPIANRFADPQAGAPPLWALLNPGGDPQLAEFFDSRFETFPPGEARFETVPPEETRFETLPPVPELEAAWSLEDDRFDTPLLPDEADALAPSPGSAFSPDHDPAPVDLGALPPTPIFDPEAHALQP
jgi:large repetitive protein